MSAALIVRFRPLGLWRFGPENGARDRVDRVFHSDSLFSALTIAMRDLGWIDEWIAATAQSQTPAVRLSSCYPYLQRALLIQPPRSVWPPAQTGKARWKSARFVPVSLISSLLRGDDLKDDQWAVEPVSGCLLPVERNVPAVAPFRPVKRSSAAVDRVNGASEHAHATAALQFSPSAGVWFLATFRDEGAREVWQGRIKAAAHLLADSGIGGERSQGWGRSDAPAFEETDFPRFLIGDTSSNGGEKAWWLLSLFSPAANDAVDWTRGNYEIMNRAGRIESRAGWGMLKQSSRMIAEGSVLLTPASPTGAVQNVAPPEIPHAVYRSGIALAVPVAWHESRRLSWLAAERAQQTAAPEPPLEEKLPVELIETVAPEVLSELQEPESPPGEPTPEEPPAKEPPAPSEPPVEEPPEEEPPTEEPPSEPPVREPGPEPTPVKVESDWLLRQPEEPGEPTPETQAPEQPAVPAEPTLEAQSFEDTEPSPEQPAAPAEPTVEAQSFEDTEPAPEQPAVPAEPTLEAQSFEETERSQEQPAAPAEPTVESQSFEDTEPAPEQPAAPAEPPLEAQSFEDTEPAPEQPAESTAPPLEATLPVEPGEPPVEAGAEEPAPQEVIPGQTEGTIHDLETGEGDEEKQS